MTKWTINWRLLIHFTNEEPLLQNTVVFCLEILDEAVHLQTNPWSTTGGGGGIIS